MEFGNLCVELGFEAINVLFRVALHSCRVDVVVHSCIGDPAKVHKSSRGDISINIS
jgi:hypothetical protein